MLIKCNPSVCKFEKEEWRARCAHCLVRAPLSSPLVSWEVAARHVINMPFSLRSSHLTEFSAEVHDTGAVGYSDTDYSDTIFIQ